MIHQLKRIEHSPKSKAKYKIIGVSKAEHEEWLWTAFLKQQKVDVVFISKRPRYLVNGCEVEWKGQQHIPHEIQQHLDQLASKIGELFQKVESS
ncbi:hypothetical protein [Pontibacillus sp. HMF3514]|uniref:hypothetical protein n=1 Tax=Pontibacillus sp. HMF3514 TaxID=2692425 RepID=UPI00131FC7EC|nr:hypothetical protein [Pontibacillus sp. HMF3514]QHE51014.1 hypothetical protein GS400_02695 [Pontibacillus sp. HMF3514]